MSIPHPNIPYKLQSSLSRVYLKKQPLDRLLRGHVYFAIDGSDKSKRYAVKIFILVSIAKDEIEKKIAKLIEATGKVATHTIAPVKDGGCKIYDNHTGYVFIVIPYIKGMSLASYLQPENFLYNPLRKRISPKDIAWLVSQIAQALSSAHSEGILHGDIRPSKIIIEGTHPVLVDLGVIKSLETIIQMPDLQDNSQVGRYHPPSSRKQIKVSKANDLYNLAAVVYELFVGTGFWNIRLARKRLLNYSKDQNQFEELLGELDEAAKRQNLSGKEDAAKEIFRKALNPDPDLRFTDHGTSDEAITKFAEALSSVFGEGSGNSWHYYSQLRTRKTVLNYIGVVLACLIIGAVAIWGVWQLQDLQQQTMFMEQTVSENMETATALNETYNGVVALLTDNPNIIGGTLTALASENSDLVTTNSILQAQLHTAATERAAISSQLAQLDMDKATVQAAFDTASTEAAAQGLIFTTTVTPVVVALRDEISDYAQTLTEQANQQLTLQAQVDELQIQQGTIEVELMRQTSASVNATQEIAVLVTSNQTTLEANSTSIAGLEQENQYYQATIVAQNTQFALLTPSPTPTSTPSATPTYTSTPTPTATVTVTATPSPTATSIIITATPAIASPHIASLAEWMSFLEAATVETENNSIRYRSDEDVPWSKNLDPRVRGWLPGKIPIPLALGDESQLTINAYEAAAYCNYAASLESQRVGLQFIGRLPTPEEVARYTELITADFIWASETAGNAPTYIRLEREQDFMRGLSTDPTLRNNIAPEVTLICIFEENTNS